MSTPSQHKYSLKRERIPQLKRFACYAPNYARLHAGDPRLRALPPLPKMVDLRPKCPPVFEQNSLGSCHDPQTEVLTRDGWKLFADLKGDELLASVDPATAKLIYEKPTRLVRLPFDGELVVGKCGHSLDFRVTPNHKMLVREWDDKKQTSEGAKRGLKDDYTFVEARDLGWCCGLMNRIVWDGEGSDNYIIPGVPHKLILPRSDRVVPMSVWLQFLGIYLAEGCFCFNVNHYKIQIAGGTECKKNYIRNLLAELGQHFLELKDRFTIENKQIYEELTRLGLKGVLAPRKFVPEFVFRQSAANIAFLLLGHRMGDGCEQNGHWSHYTSSITLANDLQRLIFLSGNESHVSVRPPRTSVMRDGRVVRGAYPEYRISMCENKNLSIERKHSISRERYTGEVFCAEVPTYHTLVTRRNYRILISGNCTSQALVTIYMFDGCDAGFDGTPCELLSRLFLYYNERLLDGCVDSDEGSTLSTGIRALERFGVCAERLWPYVVAQWRTRPPPPAYEDAKGHAVVAASQVEQCVESMKACLAGGEPIALGIQIYQSFESGEVRRSGVVPLPKPGEKCLGGHAVACVGYDDERGVFIMRNSWGVSWGDKGNFYIPYAYLTDENLTCDLWIITKITDNPSKGEAAGEQSEAKGEPQKEKGATGAPLKAVRAGSSDGPGDDLLGDLLHIRTIKALLCDVPPPGQITSKVLAGFSAGSASPSVSQITPQCAAALACRIIAAATDPSTPICPDGCPLATELVDMRQWASVAALAEKVGALLAKVALKVEVTNSEPSSTPGIVRVTVKLSRS